MTYEQISSPYDTLTLPTLPSQIPTPPPKLLPSYPSPHTEDNVYLLLGYRLSAQLEFDTLCYAPEMGKKIKCAENSVCAQKVQFEQNFCSQHTQKISYIVQYIPEFGHMQNTRMCGKLSRKILHAKSVGCPKQESRPLASGNAGPK
jgi:hypothetical protein